VIPVNKNAPAVSRGRHPNPVIIFLHLSGNKGWDYAILGTAGVLVLAFFIYGVMVCGTTSPRIQYTPADIVYGQKIRAVHAMGTGNSSQPTGFLSVDSAVKPEIRLSEKFYDFGEVDPHQVLTRTFVIANFGQSPLIILRAYTTCGCTMADFTAAEIPPSKVVLMTLQFDTGYHDMRGTTVRRGVMIETNDPDHPSQEIWIQATVR
jgi:hypothetical protein